MTNKEKFLKLLRVAKDNGWKDEADFTEGFEHASIVLLPELCLIYDDNHDVDVTHSINDLVLNWEEGEVSFLQALGKADTSSCYKQVSNEDGIYYWLDNVQELRVEWILQPTSKRLDWLFETFKHLLT